MVKHNRARTSAGQRQVIEIGHGIREHDYIRKQMLVIFDVEAEGTGLASGRPHSVKSKHRGYFVRHDVLNDGMFTCGKHSI